MTDSSSPLYDAQRLPLMTHDLPGTGGAVGAEEDFRVEEIPAYTPCGEGQHCMALVRKRGLTTQQAIQRICSALGLDRGGVGYAGMKDRRGVTTQWISFDGAEPDALRGVDEPDLKVLEAERHRNKLKTGHLRGNRFVITLRDTNDDALARGQAVLDRLARQGLPNYFGAQRFGVRGDNAEYGLRIVRGQAKPPRQKFKRRLLISALQSWLFNEVLAERLRAGTVSRLLGGEVLQPCPGGGLFVDDDPATNAPRVEGGEVVITGPILGPRMPWPADGTPALELEQRVLQRCGVDVDDMQGAGRLGRGGRRALLVWPEQLDLQPVEQGLRVTFVLPPGCYATVLLRELTKS